MTLRRRAIAREGNQHDVHVSANDFALAAQKAFSEAAPGLENKAPKSARDKTCPKGLVKYIVHYAATEELEEQAKKAEPALEQLARNSLEVSWKGKTRT